MGYRNYSTAKGRIVAQDGSGDFSTIQAAITAASSGETIFIRPGTYTEDLTCKANVNLVAYTADGMNGQVIIQGNISNATSGNVSISGIQLETNGDFALENTSTGGFTVTNCRLFATDNTLISNSGAAEIDIRNCYGDITDTGITFAVFTAGFMRLQHSIFFNTGGSTTISTFANASLFPNFSAISNGIQISGTTGTIQGSHTLFVPNINLTALDFTSTVAVQPNLSHCNFNTGNQPCLTIGAGATINVYDSTFRSTATNVISGAGQFGGANNTFQFNNGVSVGTLTPFNVGPIYVNSIQPAFLAINSTTSTNVTGDGTVVTVPLNTEIFDQGGNYNTGTFTFMAPYTGRYRFSGAVQFADVGASHTQGQLVLVTSNRSYTLWFGSPAALRTTSAPANICQVQGSCLADMDAGDTAFLQAAVSGSTLTVDFSGSAPNTYFCGELVC